MRGWRRGFRGLRLGGVFVVELIARWGSGGIHMGSIPPADCQCTRLRSCLRVGQADSSQEREVSSPSQKRRDATHLLASRVSRETCDASRCVASHRRTSKQVRSVGRKQGQRPLGTWCISKANVAPKDTQAGASSVGCPLGTTYRRTGASGTSRVRSGFSPGDKSFGNIACAGSIAGEGAGGRRLDGGRKA